MACLGVNDGDENGSVLLVLKYDLLFLQVLDVWVGGHVGVKVIGSDVFEAVKGMAEAGGVFGLRLDEAGDTAVLPTVAEYLEVFDDSVMDALDVVWSTHYRIEDVGGGGGEGVGYLV